MELVIPWISYLVCHHFGMSIIDLILRPLLLFWSSNDIKYQMMLCDESFPLDPFLASTLKTHVISSLSFSNFYFENLSVEMTRSSGPNYREGSCPIFFWSWTEDPEDLSFLHFHFQFLFWKMTWHFGYPLLISVILTYGDTY